MNKKIVAGIIVLSVACLWCGVLIGKAFTPTNIKTIGAGLYPGAPTYTVYKVGSTCYAQDQNGITEFSGTNDTIVLQAVLNTALTNHPLGSDGKGRGVNVKVCPGSYTIDPLTIYNYTTLKADSVRDSNLYDRNVLFTMRAGKTGAMITMSTGLSHEEMNSRIEGINLHGNSIATYGIFLENCWDSQVINCHISHVTKYGIYLSGTELTTVRDCGISDCGEAGIYSDYFGGEILIDNNYIHAAEDSYCIVAHGHFIANTISNNDLDGDSYGAAGLIFMDCHTDEEPLGSEDGHWKNIITNNNFHGDSLTGAAIDIYGNVSSTVISNNIFSGITAEAIQLRSQFDYPAAVPYPTNIKIIGNSFVNCGTETDDCIFLSSSVSTVITGNTFINSLKSAIGAIISVNLIISNNQFLNNTNYGVDLYLCNSTIINGNYGSGNSYGLVLTTVSNSAIIGNVMNENTNIGIYMISDGEENSLVGNIAQDNGHASYDIYYPTAGVEASSNQGRIGTY